MTVNSAIYLDYAATTTLDAEVAQHMLLAAQHVGNPASPHGAGRRLRKLLEEQRERITELLGGVVSGMHADRLVFTSGGTEANNLALLGMSGAGQGPVLISAVEHSSIAAAAGQLRRQGTIVRTIAVDSSGRISLEHLQTLLAQSPLPSLVSVMLGNNETGVVQPVAEAARLCLAAGVLLHTDAVQAVGKLAVDFRALEVDALTVAPHKFQGPLGIGALLLRHEVKLQPQLFGGFQQGGLRPGTESLPLVVGFRESLQRAVAQQPATALKLAALRDRFEQALHNRLAPLTVNSTNAARLPHISNVGFLGTDRQTLFLALDFARVFCATGSACASGSSEPSPVLQAMGVSADVIGSSLRFSFGQPTTNDDVSQAVERITRCVLDLRAKSQAAR